jgi:HIT domain
MKRDRDETDFRKVRESYNRPVDRCLFCNFPKDRVLCENELTFAIRDAFPVTPLHTLVIPKRHVSEVFELSRPETNAYNELLRRAKRDIEQMDTEVVGFNVGINQQWRGCRSDRTTLPSTFSPPPGRRRGESRRRHSQCHSGERVVLTRMTTVATLSWSNISHGIRHQPRANKGVKHLWPSPRLGSFFIVPCPVVLLPTDLGGGKSSVFTRLFNNLRQTTLGKIGRFLSGLVRVCG